MSSNHNDKNKKPHTERFLVERREFMRAALLGTLGYGSYAFLKHRGMAGLGGFVQQMTARPGLSSMDAAELFADALRFGPSLSLVTQALAANADNPAVFNVFYSTSHDSRYELNLTDLGDMHNPMKTLNFSTFGGMLTGLTMKAPAPHSIMNAWAHQIMTTGLIDGKTPFSTEAAGPALTADQVNKISVISAVGMNGGQGVHQAGIVPKFGNLSYVTQMAYPNYSPIGTVALNYPVIDSSGSINNGGNDVAGFIGTIDVPDVYMSRDQANNPVSVLDGITGDPAVKQARGQMLQAHALLTQQFNNIKGYADYAKTSFGTYGQRPLQGLAAMRLFADLFKAGLATIGSTGLSSFDFHATDCMRMPAGNNGNMVTEVSQAMAGIYYIAQAAFAAKKDAIVYLNTCSNRSPDYVADNGHVSSLCIIIKGAPNSPFAAVPAQQQLLSSAASSSNYADAPQMDTNYAGTDAGNLGMMGNATVGRLEGGIIKAIGKAIGQAPAMAVEEPAAKII